MCKRRNTCTEFKFCVCEMDNCIIKYVPLIKIIVYVNFLFAEVVIFWHVHT